MATNPITALMNEFGQEVVEKAMLNLGVYRTVNGKKRRAVASDNLRKSLTYRYDNKYKRIDFFAKGTASEYAYYVEEGRKAGKRPPIDKILEWMKIKRIQPRNENGSFKKFATPKAKENAMEGIAFNISRAIGARGIKPLFYFRDAVNETVVEFNDRFLAALKGEITVAIEENLQGKIKV
jgi:hypothetical protein